MANLIEIQRHRLKLYGEMLKNDLTERRMQEKYEKEAMAKRDSLELERHIENTKRFDQTKRMEIREMNNAVKEDNLMLTTLKKNASFTASSTHDGQNFINQIHEMDSKRLSKLKDGLSQQFMDNKDFSTSKRMIEEKIKEIERVESDRHNNRIKEMQMDSLRNYEEIKRKHQQDMHLYERHKRLVEENQNHRQQIEAFTKGRGILDRYNRNQYLQRRQSLRENQEQIMMQMQELDRRKSQEAIQYKRKVGDLENSMLASVMSKPQRYEPKAYSNELRHQMQDDSLRKLEESNSKKEKIELNNIYGGVHSNERQKMLEIIDKRLGIDRFAKEAMSQRRSEEPQMQQLYSNPQTDINETKIYMTPRSQSKGKISQSNRSQERTGYSQQISLVNNPSAKQQSELVPSQMNSSQNRRYFKSYDLITGKNKIYGAK